MKKRRLLAGLAVSLALAAGLGACSGVRVQNYEGREPRLDLVDYFTGRSEAWGMVQARDGELLRHFHVVVEGRVEEGRLLLDERFRFDDGETQQRFWTFTPDGDGRWRGRADDVIGEAHGEVAGNALHLRYTLRVPVDGRELDLAMDDWMFLLDAQTIVNRTSMRKFGFEVGEVTLFFRKQEPTQ